MNKDEIIAEIRRTAADNGGVPLGRQRFQSETGIGEKHWRGIYWARWGDALIEAGFNPNPRTEAHDRSFILDRLASLTRELQHFPTVAELQLKRRQDKTFPSPKSFERLGNKNALARHLLEYCQSREDYDDVATLCIPYAAATAAPQTLQRTSLPTRADGCVYLLQFGKLYKIGRTNAVGRREYEIQLQIPGKSRVIHEFKTDDPVGIERYWHERFKDQREHGEFFRLSAEDIAAFKRRKRFM